MLIVPQTIDLSPVYSSKPGARVEIMLEKPHAALGQARKVAGVVVNQPIGGQIMAVVRGEWCAVGFVRRLNLFYEVTYFGEPRVSVTARGSQLIKLQS